MKLLELRKNENLTQEELAKKFNLSQKTYANYENEKTQPTIETLCDIADYYNVSLDYLCEHETEHLIDTSNYPVELVTLMNVAIKLPISKLNMLNGFALRLAQEI